jgi:hypothetical protein
MFFVFCFLFCFSVTNTARFDLHINPGSIEDASKERDEAELKVAVG